jgi:hypothetical protein
MGTLPAPGQSLAANNGVYTFDRGYKWLILLAGSFLFLLILGLLISARIRHEELGTRIIALGVLELAGCIAAIVYVERRASRTLQISDEGIFIHDNQGNEMSGIRWFELRRVTERRVMGRLVLWHQSGTQRIVVDQQFEPSAAVRSRILDQYAKAFIPQPIPFELKGADLMNAQSMLMGSAVVLFTSFTWFSWTSNQQNSKVASVLFAAFAILALISFLSLYPQLRGPSTLFEDRLVLQTLFRTRTFLKRDITDIELKDATNQTGSRFSFIVVKGIGAKEAKITFVYGSIPDLYLTLRAWLVR